MTTSGAGDLANADLRNLFDSTQIATVFLDQHLVIRNFTPAVTGIFDLVPSDRGRPHASFASRLDRVDVRQEARRVLDERLVVELRVTASGGVAHYLMRMLPYTTAEGAVDGVVVTFFDITNVVESEVLKTLVDELNHRVRNVLQVVLAVATHTLRRATTLVEFEIAFLGRVRALGRAHELVSLGGWTDVSLLDLIQKELQPYTSGTDRLVTRGLPVRLRPRAALSLGMVLHEMATNATKHGALSAEHGRVTIEWSEEGSGAAARFALRWAEEGGPEVRAPLGSAASAPNSSSGCCGTISQGASISTMLRRDCAPQSHCHSASWRTASQRWLRMRPAAVETAPATAERQCGPGQLLGTSQMYR